MSPTYANKVMKKYDFSGEIYFYTKNNSVFRGSIIVPERISYYEAVMLSPRRREALTYSPEMPLAPPEQEPELRLRGRERERSVNIQNTI